MQLPDRISATWIDSLRDEDLLQVELQLHRHFLDLEAEQKKLLGNEYDLMRSPSAVMNAWDRWSVVNRATRVRGLRIRYVR
jgi:hypothetical protein